MKAACLVLAGLILIGCGSQEPSIVGTWTTDPTNRKDLWDRFEFTADGKFIQKWHAEYPTLPQLNDDSKSEGTYKLNGKVLEMDMGPEIHTNPNKKTQPAEKATATITTWVDEDHFKWVDDTGALLPDMHRVKNP